MSGTVRASLPLSDFPSTAKHGQCMPSSRPHAIVLPLHEVYSTRTSDQDLQRRMSAMLKSTRTSKHITVAVFVYRMPLSRHIRLPYLPRRSEELYETIVRNSLLAQGKIHSLILHREALELYRRDSTMPCCHRMFPTWTTSSALCQRCYYNLGTHSDNGQAVIHGGRTTEFDCIHRT